MADETDVHGLEVVVEVPAGQDIDDLIFEIEGSGAAGPDARISVSSVEAA